MPHPLIQEKMKKEKQRIEAYIMLCDGEPVTTIFFQYHHGLEFINSLPGYERKRWWIQPMVITYSPYNIHPKS